MKTRNISTSLKQFGLVAVLVASAAGSFTTARADDDAPKGDPVNGKKIYLADGCFECHGRAGQGGNFNYPTPALAQMMGYGLQRHVGVTCEEGKGVLCVGFRRSLTPEAAEQTMKQVTTKWVS